MEDDATRDVATVLKAVRGLTAQEFDSALLPPVLRCYLRVTFSNNVNYK